MGHSTDRGKRKPQKQTVEKAQNTNNYNVPVTTNLDPNVKRMRLGATSLPSLKTMQGQIQEEARTELRFPRSAAVYKQMSLDASIASSLSLIEAIISKAEWKVTVPKDAPQAEKDRAEKLNYNLLVMDRPFNEYISEMLSYLTYGFHAPEKLYKRMDTPVGKFVGWKDFRTISQDTIREWIFEKSTGDLAGLKQDLALLANTNLISAKEEGSVEVPRKKFMLIRNNPKRDNPEGQSPLRGAYVTWKYLQLVEEFETIYATKGLGGVLDLGIDVGFLSKAAADPAGTEAAVLNEMRRGAANFHNGEQAYIETPLAYNDTGKPLFHTKILETTPPNTDEIVKRHTQKILQQFFTDILQLGANGSGSFALSDNKNTLVQQGITQHLNTIKRTLNHDLIRQTYELNSWEYDARTACRFEWDDFDDGDLDVLSKSIQRIFSVNALDRTTDVEDWVRGTFMDLPPKGEANTEVREVDDGQSRAGEGLGTSGTGNSQDSEDTSISNTENS